MKLSIVTVIKDDYDGILLTYESIKGLIKSPHIEWVVIDGGDCDRTSDFILSLDNINYSKGKDGGIYQAMNKAIKKCSGNYVWFLNARDICLISLSDINKYLSNQNHDLIKFFAKVDQENYTRFEQLSIFYLIRHTFNHQSYFVRLEKLKEFPFSGDLSLAGDYYQLLNLWTSNSTIQYISKDIVQYDMSGATVGAKTNNEIRRERLKSSFLIAKERNSIQVFLICVVQFIIYLPYLLKEKIVLLKPETSNN